MRTSLAGVNISDSGNEPRVHQQLLDRYPTITRQAEQRLAVERLGERLDAEPGQQWMHAGVARPPDHGAEAARVAHSQDLFPDTQVEMIVRTGRLGGRYHAQAARHAQMHDERAAIAFDDQVLATPTDVAHPLAPQRSRQISLDGPAQPAVPYRGTGQDLSGEERLDAAPRDLYLGKFWHAPQSPAGGTFRARSRGFLVRSRKYT
jgi:hypothetical protein